MRVVVTGTGMTAFGELWSEDAGPLAYKAAREALGKARLTIDAIDYLVVGNMLLPYVSNQSHVGATIAQACEFVGPAMAVEAACASGGVAVRQAVALLLSGQAKRVLVVGVEKMTDVSAAEITEFLAGASSEEERSAGATFPSLYGLMHQAYQAAYGYSDETMAQVSVKNHTYGSLNPLAHFQSTLTTTKVLTSPLVADPMRLLHCSPVSDGAAALVLESRVKTSAGDIEIMASSQAGDRLSLSRRKSLTSLEATKQAAAKAFFEAGISAKEIDVAEVHDCFSVAELMAVEDLGFAPTGKAAQWIADGYGFIDHPRFRLNTSGGLKACGHPVGATGVKQLVEVANQLSGTCGARQHPHATYGLTHNVGGTGASVVVHILGRVK